MKTLISFAVALMAAGILHAEHIALIGGTVINPADGKITRNATVFIDNGRISSIAAGMVMKYSGRTINCVGKFILPGYIDTHVHFLQSADLFTRPDGADFNTVRPYKDEVAWIKSHLDDVFTRYLRCGITSLVDVGRGHAVDPFRPTGRTTIEESHAHKIRVAVRATELGTARAAVEEGANMLVHSVVDRPVDGAFVKLLKDRHIILCPTLVVLKRY